MLSRRPHWLLPVGLLTLAAVLLIAPDAYAAKSVAQAATAAGLVKSASVVGPLGISPFFALAGFGLAGFLGVWQLPLGLEPFSHPAVWALFLALGLLLQFGRSAKLTKPLAEVVGTGESLFAIVAATMVMVPHFSPPAAAQQAGVVVGGLMLLAGLSAVVALVILRTALDILIWMSPVPFVDGLFQLVKLAVTIGLVLLAVLFPPAAIVVNLLILVATALLVRWALRTARFGATVVFDVATHKFRDKVAMPRDPAVETDLGPFVAFAMDVPTLPKRTHGRVERDAGRWFLVASRTFGGEGTKVVLGDDPDVQLTKGFLGLELTSPKGRILLPARYKHLDELLFKETRVQPGAKPTFEMPRRARAAQASAV